MILSRKNSICKALYGETETERTQSRPICLKWREQRGVGAQWICRVLKVVMIRIFVFTLRMIAIEALGLTWSDLLWDSTVLIMTSQYHLAQLITCSSLQHPYPLAFRTAVSLDSCLLCYVFLVSLAGISSSLDFKALECPKLILGSVFSSACTLKVILFRTIALYMIYMLITIIN